MSQKGESTVSAPTFLRVQALLTTMPVAVLCTQGLAGPVGSLMACVTSDDLAQIAFATRRATRKYEQLVREPRVALVFDDRAQAAEGDMLQQVTVVTATGRATELAPGPVSDAWSARLAAQHPGLRGFLTEQDVALFVVRVDAFEVVARFEHVERWIPVPHTA